MLSIVAFYSVHYTATGSIRKLFQSLFPFVIAHFMWLYALEIDNLKTEIHEALNIEQYTIL